jgi:hypothetical protein
VDTTAFSTLCCKKRLRWFNSAAALVRLLKSLRSLRLYCLCILLSLGAITGQRAWAADPGGTEVTALRVERTDEGFFLSATIAFDLPGVVEEALLKGVPMAFVSEVDVYRDRWYWYDKRISTATRSVRIAYQPLTRRWRVNVASGTIVGPTTGIALTQHFDNLPDALATVRRIARWKIADNGDIDADARHNIEYRFKLDLSQLPRPLQIGVVGQGDWSINAARNVRPEARSDIRPEARP